MAAGREIARRLAAGRRHDPQRRPRSRTARPPRRCRGRRRARRRATSSTALHEPARRASSTRLSAARGHGVDGRRGVEVGALAGVGAERDALRRRATTRSSRPTSHRASCAARAHRRGPSGRRDARGGRGTRRRRAASRRASITRASGWPVGRQRPDGEARLRRGRGQREPRAVGRERECAHAVRQRRQLLGVASGEWHAPRPARRAGRARGRPAARLRRGVAHVARVSARARPPSSGTIQTWRR